MATPTASPFQPTLPARGATFASGSSRFGGLDFNPRSPHGERLMFWRSFSPTNRFQPTLPARGATQHSQHAPHHSPISTHAPRTGSDDYQMPLSCLRRYFNPRSPHGERPTLNVLLMVVGDFNPRSPHGERPMWQKDAQGAWVFQPTLPARGATGKAETATKKERFQPTLPARGATQQLRDAVKSAEISTHAPRTGSDGPPDAGKGRNGHISTHAPRTGSDLLFFALFRSSLRHFNPRSPHGERRFTTAGKCPAH